MRNSTRADYLLCMIHKWVRVNHYTTYATPMGNDVLEETISVVNIK